MSDFFEQFMAKLEHREDRVNGEDIVKAERNLPEDVTRPIPICIFKNVEVPVNPSDVSGPTEMAYVPRMDVLCVLAWVIAQRHDPNITLETVSQGINNDNARRIIDDIWQFWLGREFYTDEETGESDTVNPTERSNHE